MENGTVYLEFLEVRKEETIALLFEKKKSETSM